MAIRRYRGWGLFPDIQSIDDDLAQINEWLNPFRTSWTTRGLLVDPDKYEIKPKESYLKTLIENKQKELDKLDEERKVLEEELRKLKTG